MLNIIEHQQMLIKTSLSYLYTFTRTAKNKETSGACWQGHVAMGTPILYWWEYKMEMVQPLGKTVLQFPTKWNRYLPYNSVTPFVKQCPNKDLYVRTYSRYVINSPKLEVIQMFTNSGMIEQFLGYPCSGILCNKKKQIADTCKNMDVFQMHYAKWKTPDSRGYIVYLYDFLEKTKLWPPQSQGCQGL